MVTKCVREFVRNAFGRQGGGRELLALDIGTSRTGVAISRRQKMARPMGIISHSKGQSVANSMPFLSELALTHDVAGVVVGWPLEDSPPRRRDLSLGGSGEFKLAIRWAADGKLCAEDAKVVASSPMWN